MKKILIALLCALHFAASAQQQFTAPVPHWAGAPTGTPSTQGARVRYDQTAGKWYFWNGATWLLQPDGVAQVSGLTPPAYTPGVGQSQFAINAANELYRWRTGTTWDCINCGGAVEPAQQILYGTGTGTDSDANFTRDAANNDLRVFGSNANLSLRTDDTTGVLSVYENNDAASKAKLSLAGNGARLLSVPKHTNALTKSIADFYFNRSFFDDVSSAGDNQVVNMGFNVSVGGGLVDYTKNGAAWVFENNYKNAPSEPGSPGFGFYEFQWPEIIYSDTITDQNGVRRSTGVPQNTKRRLIAGYCSNERPSFGGAWATATDHINVSDFKTGQQRTIFGFETGGPYIKGIDFLDTAFIRFNKNNVGGIYQMDTESTLRELIKLDNQDRLVLYGQGQGRKMYTPTTELQVLNSFKIAPQNTQPLVLGDNSTTSQITLNGISADPVKITSSLNNTGYTIGVANYGFWFRDASTNNQILTFDNNVPAFAAWFRGTSGNLGLGAYPDFDARLHIKRTSDAASSKLFMLENSTGKSVLFRSNATPEGAITASPGDITLTNESSTGKVYVKRTGTGNTGHSELQQKADAYMPLQKTDAAALNGELYYSTTQSKLCYKDPGGTVNPLY